MTEQNKEKISALMDDELDVSASDAAVDHLLKHQEARHAAVRYRMIGAALRGEKTFVQSLDISADIAKALADEPTVLAPKKRRFNAKRFAMPVLGGAIAASVAAATVVFVPSWFGTAAVTSVPTVTQAPKSQVQYVKWRTQAENGNPKLNRYLMEHNEVAGRTGINGPAAHVSLVSYGAR